MDWIKFTRTEKEVAVLIDTPVATKPPVEAALSAIEHIVANYPAPYTLMLSGGADSQAMLWCWLKSGYEFQTRSVRFNGGLNDHDLQTMQEFSNNVGVSFTPWEFDLLEFLDGDYAKYATKYECSSPQICTHMKMCEDLDGTVIFSGNFAGHTRLLIDDAIMGLKRYTDISKKPIVPFFFLHTPELAFSLCRSTTSSTVTFSGKLEAYKLAGIPIVPQPIKYTGFEHVKDLYDQSHKHKVTPKMRLRYAGKPSRRVFDLLLRYPYEEAFGNPKYTFTINSSPT